MDQTNLFFSQKRPAAAVQGTGESSTQASVAQAPAVTEPGNYYFFFIDDFDIDDFNDSDIPDYFEPPSSSVSRQDSSSVSKAVREGGPSTSTWQKKPATPAPVAKPPKITSPGKYIHYRAALRLDYSFY